MSTRRSSADEREQVGAIGAMDRDAPALRHVADHRVAGHRLAALRVPDHEPVDALNLDAPADRMRSITRPKTVGLGSGISSVSESA